MQILSISENDSILIIAPHPDDECIGAGGILSLFPDICDVWVLTDGSLGQGKRKPESERLVRREEFTREMHWAGVRSFKLFNIEDGILMQHTDCLMNMDLSGYSKVFVTGMQDNHPDHTAAFLCVVNALKSLKVKPQLFVYEVHAQLSVATHMLDITEVIDTKMELIRFHKSQLSVLAYDRMARVNAEYRALQSRLSDRLIETYLLVDPPYHNDQKRLELEEKLQKQIQFYQMMVKWIAAKNRNLSITQYLADRGLDSVAVYGYAELGKLALEELRNGKIQVPYILDKKAIHTQSDETPIYIPRAGLPKVGAVVVTATYYFDEIKEELQQMGFRNVLSLKQIIDAI